MTPFKTARDSAAKDFLRVTGEYFNNITFDSCYKNGWNACARYMLGSEAMKAVEGSQKTLSSIGHLGVVAGGLKNILTTQIEFNHTSIAALKTLMGEK